MNIITRRRFLAAGGAALVVVLFAGCGGEKPAQAASAVALVSGRIVNAAGDPVVRHKYLVLSESLNELRYMKEFPRTNANGEFRAARVPSGESATVILILSEDRAAIWRDLTPRVERVLELREDDAVQLPPEWDTYGDFWTLLHVPTVPTGVVSFELPDLEGTIVSLDDERFANRVVLINFWGTWCGGCQYEAPHLAELQREFKDDGLEVIGIAFEKEDDVQAVDVLRQYVLDKHLDYTILFGGLPDSDNVERVVTGIEGFGGYPTTIVLGRDKHVRHIEVGFKSETEERIAWNVARLREQIRKALE